MEYAEYVCQLAAENPDLASEVAGFNTLENVLNWMRRKELPFSALDVVFQDEYSHDVILPLPGESRCLVFGIT
jgi:hypothetical protein